MILAALLLQAAAPQSAVDAERAFNAAAQAKGQWTAFRETAAPDAVMFQPGPVKALDWMKGKADPPKAVEWWPTESYVSCNGKLAVNTGGWVRPNGSVGYFTTVWQRQADGGWKWIVDHGDVTKTGRDQSARPPVRTAHCSIPPTWEDDVIFTCPDTATCGHDDAEDGTLSWWWAVYPDGRRTFETSLWTGSAYERVINDEVAAPQ